MERNILGRTKATLVAVEALPELRCLESVSYTHLTMPTAGEHGTIEA